MNAITSLNPLVTSALAWCFPNPKEQTWARKLLQEECGSNLPACENETPTTPLLERIRLAALKTSQGDREKLKWAVSLAKLDFRDLLVEAGFADEIDSARKWALSFTTRG